MVFSLSYASAKDEVLLISQQKLLPLKVSPPHHRTTGRQDSETTLCCKKEKTSNPFIRV
jgi:hypothetical protein